MATAIRMPDMGTTVDEVILAGWLIDVGESAGYDAALASDHRLINGRPAAHSLSRLKEIVETGAFL